MNPTDVKSPLTLVLADHERFKIGRFSLDAADEETDAWLHDVLNAKPRLLHELVAQDPVAATKCFHYTVRLVVDTLFNCVSPGHPCPDGKPCREVPGVFGLISGYLGVVEPQMRKALHIHMLVQLHGFSHPEDLITSGAIANVFRRVWRFVSTICFRSPEAFAHYTQEASAMALLKTTPLMPFTPKQRNMIGEERVQQSICAQKQARGMPMQKPTNSTEVSGVQDPTTAFSEPGKLNDQKLRYYVPALYGNATADASAFAAASQTSNYYALCCQG